MMMKITREEKQLYKFLDCINKIFGKTDERTYIVGMLSKLYFYAPGYCGVFESIENIDRLIDAYDFDTCIYQLKQLPNKSFVLDKIDGDALRNARTRDNTVSYVEDRMDDNWVDEMDKHYTKKIAKVASVTGKWISDDDIGYLKMFDIFNIHNGHDYLRFETGDDLSNISLIFTASAVVPDENDSSQMKIEAYVENNQESSEEPPEEFEDEEYDDPMA